VENAGVNVAGNTLNVISETPLYDPTMGVAYEQGHSAAVPPPAPFSIRSTPALLTSGAVIQAQLAQVDYLEQSSARHGDLLSHYFWVSSRMIPWSESSTLNGLPQTEGRATLRAPSGIRQPFVRRCWMRSGIASS
jgi:hypothetical protein